MKYCPHCSAPLHKVVDVCPECKNVINFELIGSLYEEGASSELNIKAKRKIWFKEHALIIFPLIALIIGLVAGGILMYGYLQIAFANERNDYEAKISELNATISQKNSAAASSSQEFTAQLAAKDEIINILKEQMELMGRAVNFTSRLARNSTITPTSTDEADFYRRNILFLNSELEKQEEALTATAYEAPRNYSLITIPQLVEE